MRKGCRAETVLKLIVRVAGMKVGLRNNVRI